MAGQKKDGPLAGLGANRTPCLALWPLAHGARGEKDLAPAPGFGVIVRGKKPSGPKDRPGVRLWERVGALGVSVLGAGAWPWEN